MSVEHKRELLIVDESGDRAAFSTAVENAASLSIALAGPDVSQMPSPRRPWMCGSFATRNVFGAHPEFWEEAKK